jgi:hypothetical protein
MKILRFRIIAGLISGPAIIAGALVASTPASASPALTPPPAPFQTCKTDGNGFTTCEGSTSFTYGPLDSGIGCGTGAGAFDISDEGTANVDLVSRYNADGNQTEQVLRYQAFAQYSNPLTGSTVPYIQHQTDTAVPAVPGDFSLFTDTVTGQNNFTVPHMGAVALNAGRVVRGLDGSVIFSAGPQVFNDYFMNGNTAAVAELCTALGAS